MNYDDWKTHNPAEDVPDIDEVFPVEDWRKAVAKGETVLGWDEWQQEKAYEQDTGPDPDEVRDRMLEDRRE